MRQFVSRLARAHNRRFGNAGAAKYRARRFSFAASGFQALEPRLALAAEFIISEFMASNKAGIADSDGDRSDWIEVQNIGGMNAQGVVVRSDVPWGLTNQSANLSGTACSVSANTWSCTLDLPAGGPAVSLGLTVGPRLVIANETVLNGITAEVDAPHAIFERDETNNTTTATVAVP